MVVWPGLVRGDDEEDGGECGGSETSEEVGWEGEEMADLLDRIELPFCVEVDVGAGEIAPIVSVTPVVKGELPRWIRDPFFVSNKSWTDIDDEDDEY